jgi:predicted regulator of Ras-like GTPase activity (Roadblock/LC7/MglB family)
MFGFIKNFFTNKPANGNDSAPAPQPPVTPGPKAPQPMRVPVPQSAQRPTHSNVPPMPKAEPKFEANGASAPAGATVALPMLVIVNNLPPELKSHVVMARVGDASFSVALDKVIQQLSLGVVRVSFGDLRRAAPQAFSPAKDCDHVQVALPLNELLSRINPAALIRRQGQRQVEVPEEISSPFADRGKGLGLASGAGKPGQPPTPARAVTPAAPKPMTPPPTRPMAVPPAKPAPNTPAHSTQANSAVTAPGVAAIPNLFQVKPAQPTAPAAPATPAKPAPIQFKPVPTQPVQPAQPAAAAPAAPELKPAQPVAFQAPGFPAKPAPTPSTPPPLFSPKPPIAPAPAPAQPAAPSNVPPGVAAIPPLFAPKPPIKPSAPPAPSAPAAPIQPSQFRPAPVQSPTPAYMPPKPVSPAAPAPAESSEVEPMQTGSIPFKPMAFAPVPPPAAPAPSPAPVPPPAAEASAQPIPFNPSRSSFGSMPTAPTPPAPASPSPADSAPSIPASAALRNLSMSPAAPRPAMPAPTPSAPIRPAMSMAAPAAPVAPIAPVAPVAAQPIKDVPSLNVTLLALSEGWPEAVRTEIEQLNLVDSLVALPIETVEPALKRGKVTFPWKTVRSWVRPAVPAVASPNDTVSLELPLRILAPMFLSRVKENKSQQKVRVDEEIPNLFFGFPQGESNTVTAPAPAAAPAPAPVAFAPAPVAPPPAPAPVAMPQNNLPAVAPAPAAAAAAPAAKSDTNYYVWDDTSESAKVDETTVKRKTGNTDFLRKSATPNDVVTRASALDGVSGALIALPDGLMVASKLAPDLNGDTIAAFLPHLFGKVSTCTKELRMGELNNLNFTVGNVPWKIFRVNAIFFAVFGQAGRPMPGVELAALAAELDHKKQ